MLRIQTSPGGCDCSGLSRRDFLRVGALGVAGLTLPRLLANKSLAAETGLNFIRDKSVVLLFLSGGASHIETFNPNMDAPAPYYSLTAEVKTSLAGLTFGGTFPLLAKWAHKMAIVRSFRHSITDHEAAHLHVLSGGTDRKGNGSEGYSIGSIYSRLGGASNPKSGLPTYAALTNPEVDTQYSTEQVRFMLGSRPGTLGPNFAPFQHNGDAAQAGQKSAAAKKSRVEFAPVAAPGSVVDDMTLHLSPERLRDRRELLGGLDRLRRELDSSGQMDASDKHQQQAFDLILGSARQAFDLSNEDARLVARYDTSDMQIGHKAFRPSTLGHQMLLARRLCEAGCGFVAVHSAGWDMHADGNNPDMITGMNMLGPTVDKSVSAFLEDVESRGLCEKILLVITGDFGRTPKINARGGRDHWANLGTLAFAGGGLKMGQVIGRSDRSNSEPASDPISPAMMMATILHTLFDIGQLRLAAGAPRDLLALAQDGQPIGELF